MFYCIFRIRLEYCIILSCLYRAITEESGDRVIVDSSKFPGHGLAISRLPGVEFHVLHLVRDPRALAHAWQQKRIYDSSGEKTVWFSVFTPSACSWLWMRWNLAIEAMWQDHPGYRFVRYEDFITEPVATVAEILGGLGLESAHLPFVSDHEVALEPTHAMAGNPSRFSLGVVPLRLDAAWKETQSASERRLVTALTWPLLQRYGYLSD